ncbi:UPF0158 family protein [Proteinivorax hydrogeniformans]|uniref:UPF0158 family protein n=1 Tax=Proteinivorax hydrogeniformans TaxID=1826727 RepID=A0AAU8HUG2_9FIRM
MSVVASLDEIVEAMELQSDDDSPYLSLKTGEVVVLSAEDIRYAEDEVDTETLPDWQKYSVEIAQEVIKDEEENYIPLPSEFVIHEYSIMEAFCYNQEGDIRSQLLNSIQKRGAFRRFKDDIIRFGIADKWYKYKEEALKDIAIQWCKSHNIKYN